MFIDKKISVIVPVYNTACYLEKCVNSICNQTYSNLEIILVDDGSTDEISPILCDQLANSDNRIKVIHKKNGGLSSARNVGLEVVTGDYITFVDSDDYLSKDMYSQILEASTEYLENENAILCGGFVRVDEDDTILQSSVGEKSIKVTNCEYYIRSLLMHNGDVSVCTKLFPNKLMNNHKFQEDRLNEDLLFMMELMPYISHMVFSGNKGYHYLCRSNSISNGYGRSVADMVGNAELVCDLIRKSYPSLTIESWRFLLTQRSAYMLLLPDDMRNSNNQIYVDNLHKFRSEFLHYGINNKYIQNKSKLIMMGQLISPSFIAWMYRKKK